MMKFNNVVFIANIISLIAVFLKFYIDTIINRKKYFIFNLIINFLYLFSYMLLGGYSAIFICIYSIINNFLVLFVLHKDEEKIILNKKEALYLSLPYLIIGIIAFKYEQYLSILVAVFNFLNSFCFVLKKDLHLQIFKIFYAIEKIIYAICFVNIVDIISNVITIFIKISNVIKILKYGENKFYTTCENKKMCK